MLIHSPLLPLSLPPAGQREDEDLFLLIAPGADIHVGGDKEGKKRGSLTGLFR